MIKTIKVKKKLRLDELIKYIFDNDVKRKEFFIHGEGEVENPRNLTVDYQGMVRFYFGIYSGDIFTVEVEEEITEDTALVGFQEVFLDKELRELKVEIHAPLKRKSINDVLEEHYEETECLQIYAKVNGKLELVWEAE